LQKNQGGHGIFQVSLKRLESWAYRRLFPPVIAFFVRMVSISLRLHWVGREKLEPLWRENRRLVYAFWHGRHFMMIHPFRNRKISVLTSTSRDGRLLADALTWFGYDNIPGSSHKSPVRALMASVQKTREGFDIAFAVDGPTGPRHQVKPGALFVAKKANAWIVPLSFSAGSSWTFHSWDRYLLPKPFARIVLILGDPYRPSSDLSAETVEKERLELERTLLRLDAEADAAVGKKV
jgi:lysophospholipid acyltransferase (LPLAT)-like uncharacterized protein